jgi:hypothetical protein
MQVEMTSTLTEGNQVDPVATTHRLDEFGSLLNDCSPFIGFISQKVDRTSKMATCIEQTPTEQRRRMGMMTQEPMAIAPDLYFTKIFNIGVKLTNRTVL